MGNMGGLAVTDNYHESGTATLHHDTSNSTVKSNSHQHLVFNAGWGGMGLHGNHNSAQTIQKSTSAGSGLFFMDDDLSSADEATGSTNNIPELRTSDSLKRNSSSNLKEAYIKTTNMANFYYRRSDVSQENIAGILHPNNTINRINSNVK